MCMITMAATLTNGLRALFFALGCMITSTVIYTLVTDGTPFRKELLTPWMAATLVDFYINVLAIGAWVLYKEPRWISALLWLVLLVCLGSIATCAYIFFQLLRLSPQEATEDPIYHVLHRSTKKDAAEQKTCSVIIARCVFGVLSFVMLGTLVYTIVTDGSPFRLELLTPWLSATLIDFYVNIIALAVWVAYKESSWITASLWIVLLICFGSLSTCVYIVVQLFHLSPQDPVHLVLFNSSNSQRL
ncbi:hypothetical protein Leryth_021553 [Lithospermum erythrorhizon]|nr:hypothetical protein Leryth_021553 [Lithospermum erythrorhizon]